MKSKAAGGHIEFQDGGHILEFFQRSKLIRQATLQVWPQKIRV